MVLSRNGMIHPCIKEAGVSGTTSRPITKRVAELPSLRYGPIGARTTGTGPLRVTTTHYHESDTIPKRSSKKSNISNDTGSFKPVRPPRRVRFSLPSPDGDVTTPSPPALPPPSSADVQQPQHRHQRNRDVGVAGVWNISNGGGASRAFSHSHPSDVVVSRRSVSAAKLNGERAIVGNNNSGSLVTSNKRNSFPLSLGQQRRCASVVEVATSPGARCRVHPTAKYAYGTLSPTASAAAPQGADAQPPSPGAHALLAAARDCEDAVLKDYLRRATLVGLPEEDLNAVDPSGRTVLSYIASNGSIDLLELILQLPGLDPNKADNEGNTPLHFVAQAGQMECLNCMLSRCRGIEIDARNNLGFTPLMKAALQGRNKCAKLLLFAGANPTLRDNGRGFRADQWARFCGRYVCADVIEKYARQRLLERSTSYGNWGGDHELGARVLMGKVVPVPPMPQQSSNGLKSKLRKVFRTSSGPGNASDSFSSARLVTQLTSAALCASSPVLPSAPTVPPVVKSLIRPLTVPRLQITLVNNNGDFPNNNVNTNDAPKVSAANQSCGNGKTVDEVPVVKPVRTKKKK
ncbi:uncharacterized protein LOC109605661 isoform X2 [Aethina tumida]|uniref:uncharacterized protein LOC109605661 isoform X2 n=1 Tax=Aethina tumida TaxID=116153 RepID=UPI002147EA8E|nr:uncharacterized protein LOC109605661 isoform X2 [Aethina tumida]